MTMNKNKRNAKRIVVVMGATLVLVVGGCGSGNKSPANRGFFTSGSREADQRAEQRMAKAEQLEGTGAGNEKGSKTAKNPENVTDAKSSAATDKAAVDKKVVVDGKVVNTATAGAAAQVQGKTTLYDRLGGEKGVTAIVNDFMPRALQDPRVNWKRNGVKHGGFNWSRNKPATWDDSPANVEQLKKHLVQFLTLSTGGPAHYDGKDMASSHAGLHITNPEFDAAIGDLKASLDQLQIANKEQKELLAIVESTRPQVVEQR